jgi:hypothetical protein
LWDVICFFETHATLRDDLAARGLVTQEAQEWLTQLPNVAEHLLLRPDLQEIEQAKPIEEPHSRAWRTE